MFNFNNYKEIKKVKQALINKTRTEIPKLPRFTSPVDGRGYAPAYVFEESTGGDTYLLIGSNNNNQTATLSVRQASELYAFLKGVFEDDNNK